MADAQVQIVISAKDSASSVLKHVGGAAADLAKTLAIGLAAGGAAVAAGLGVAVNAAAGFEQKMSAVKAVSGATASEMAQLSGLALKLGKDTSFSASQAASGLEALVKGGVTIPEIMNGAAEATLALAAAGGVDLANAAEIAANALNTFNLSGADMENVANKIAGAANASTIDVNDFRLSMAAAGAVTALVGGSFDDMAVAITAMGNAGIKGSDAGTSLKSMLLNLNPITDKQVGLMRDLGIVTANGANKFFDAQGSLKSFADVSQVLQDALAGQTDQQKLATLETLFGSDAIRAAAVFAEQGADGFNTLAESIGKISAADVAATRLDNLKGDLEQLGGAAEVAAITLGQSFQAPLRAVTKGLTDFINQGITPFIEQHGPVFAAAVVDAGKGLGEFAESTKRAAISGLDDFGKKLDEIGARAAPWAAEHGAAGKAVELSLSGVHGVAQALQFLLEGNFSAAAVTAGDALGNFGGAAQQTASALNDTLSPAVDIAREKFLGLQAAMQITAAAASDRGVWDDLTGAQRDLGSAASDLDATFRGLAAALVPVRVEGEATGESFNLAAEVLKRFSDRGHSMAAGAVTIAGAVRGLGDVFNFVGQKADEMDGAVQRVKDVLATSGPSFQTLIALAQELGANIATAIGQSGPVIQGFAAQVGAAFSGVGSDVQTAGATIGAFFSQIGSNAQSMIGQVGGAFSALGSGVQSLAAQAGGAFSQLGSNAQALVAQVGGAFSALGSGAQGLATQVGGAFSQLGSNAQSLVADVGEAFSSLGSNARAAGDGINTFFLAISAAVQSAIYGIRDTISQVWSQIPENIRQDLEAIGTDLQELGRIVGARFAAMPGLAAQGLASLASTVGGKFAEMGETVGSAFSQLGSVVSARVTAVVSIVGAGFSQIGTITSERFTQMTSAVGAAFSNLGATVTTRVQAVVALVGAGFSQLGTIVSERFNQMTVAVGAAFSQLGTIASARAQATVAMISDGFSRLGTLTLTQFTAMTTAAGAVFSQLGSLVSSRAQALVSSVGDGFSRLGTIASQKFGEMTAAIASAFAGLISGVVAPQAAAVTSTVGDGLSGLAAAAAAKLADMAAAIGSALGGMAATAGAQAATIGASVVSGLAGGIAAGVGQVTSAARSLVASALAAARNALPGGEPHSPWPAFEELGVNVAEGLAAGIEEGASLAKDAAAEMAEGVAEATTESLEGIQPEVTQAGIDLGQSVADAIGAGLGKVKTIEAGVDSLKGTVAGAMRDLAGEVDKLNRETERKFSEVGQKVGRAVRLAAEDANRSIRDITDDVADRISEMNDDLNLSRLIRGRRDTFSKGQSDESRARSNTSSDTDLQRSRTRDLEDLTRDRTREDAEDEIRLARDLAKAKTDEERNGIRERAAESREELTRRRQAEDQDLAYRRTREDEDRAHRRKAEAEDRSFSQGQDAARQAFDDNLENEALGRSIERANQDRDARIKTLNEALVKKQADLRADAATEQADLLAATKLKTQTLKDEFVANLPPLLAGAQEIVNNFLLGIDQAFERVAGLAGIATISTGIVGAAFGTTAEAAQTMADQLGISLDQAKAILADGGAFAKAVMATDVPDVFEVTNNAVEEFAHRFGIDWEKARTTLTEGGRIADLVMGREIPKAAAETATAVGKAATAAADLKAPVKGATDQLATLAKDGFDTAKDATDKAKDAATQISAVLQGLADKMPALVQGIKDFGAELAKLPREIVVNIRTVGSVNAGAGSGGGGGGNSGDSGEPSDSSGGSVDWGLANQDTQEGQHYRDQLRKDNEVGRNDDGTLYIEPKAKGGPVKKDTPYLVGEKGPEIFTPKQQGVIIPNDMAAEMAKYLSPRQRGGPVSPGQRYLAGERGAEVFVPKQGGTALSAAPIDYERLSTMMADKIVAGIARTLPGVQLSVGVDDIHSALVRKSGRNGGTLGF